MAIDGASHHDSQGAVFGSEGSVKGPMSVEGTWVNLSARLADEGCWPDTAQKLHADR